MQVVDIEKYCVLIVSPRNHFLFTPMLPATAVGSVEFRSLLEPGMISALQHVALLVVLLLFRCVPI